MTCLPIPKRMRAVVSCKKHTGLTLPIPKRQPLSTRIDMQTESCQKFAYTILFAADYDRPTELEDAGVPSVHIEGDISGAELSTRSLMEAVKQKRSALALPIPTRRSQMDVPARISTALALPIPTRRGSRNGGAESFHAEQELSESDGMLGSSGASTHLTSGKTSSSCSEASPFSETPRAENSRRPVGRRVRFNMQLIVHEVTPVVCRWRDDDFDY
eukprot:TRINITY_DN58591_c0_g1_i2.p1 TRINITY_DN58591_c0_g1~~TRINITY_DN58591_c0_g1_i2.p1  ORF type:complete len:242 (-),score=28.40 TRINITY_DN58591_c0_g1_i2:171-818(-)